MKIKCLSAKEDKLYLLYFLSIVEKLDFFFYNYILNFEKYIFNFALDYKLITSDVLDNLFPRAGYGGPEYIYIKQLDGSVKYRGSHHVSWETDG